MPPAAVPLPVRFLDVLLVVAFLPFALLAGLPAFGVLAGALAWIAQRAAGVYIDQRAAAAPDARRATGIAFIGVMGRPLLMFLTILAVGLLGDREDGLAAAILVLAAFTVHLVLTIVLRPQGKSST